MNESAMPSDSMIFHIANNDDVSELERNDQYRCISLDNEGFIHCCDRQQLPGVVERYYHGIDGLVLLVIDPNKLEHALVRENTVGGQELFPHIYGPVNADAIADILDFGLSSNRRMLMAQ